MKHATLYVALAAALLATAGCTHKITISRSQAATISPQALDTLKTFRVFRLPLIKPSDKMLQKARAQFAVLEAGQLEEMKARFRPLIEDTVVGQVKVKIITPVRIPAGNEDKFMLYIHGGGYIMGSATDRTGMLMANELGMKTYSIDYQLAPEAKYPVALNECLEVYRYLVSKYDAGKIIGVSTSAGSGHMMGMLLKAQQQHLPMIRAIALLSPGIDLANLGDAATANDGRDLLAARNMADKFFAAPFAGKASVTDPLVSPIYATYDSSFPATVIVTGTRDLFLSASTRLYWKLREVHVPTELLVSEGMWHAFTNYADLPEAVQSRKAVDEFLLARLGNTAWGQAFAAMDKDTARNIAIVRRFINEVVNGGHLELIDELWAPDLLWSGGSLGTVHGAINYKKMMEASVGSAFTHMHLDIKDIVAAGDKVVLRFTNSGQNTGSFLGMPATNKSALWVGIGIYRLHNGKIAEAFFAEDLLQMFLDLGITTLPAMPT